jgi:hypothetical protein
MNDNITNHNNMKHSLSKKNPPNSGYRNVNDRNQWKYTMPVDRICQGYLVHLFRYIDMYMHKVRYIYRHSKVHVQSEVLVYTWWSTCIDIVRCMYKVRY